MISIPLKINLIRESLQFEASLAFVRGALPDLEKHLEMLHPKEQEIYQEYKYDRRKASYLLGRFSCKVAILKLLDINQANAIWIDSGVFHFPIVRCPAAPNIQVSISHCDDVGLGLAFPEAHPMGIDFEKIDAGRTELIQGQLTGREKELLAQISESNASGFFCLFSIKEALAKVLKTGMMLDFKFLEVDKIEVNHLIWETTFSNFSQYKAFTFMVNGYVLSIVLPKRTTIPSNQLYQLIDLINAGLK